MGRGLHALGAGAPTQQGSVVQMSTSDGGVPKRRWIGQDRPEWRGRRPAGRAPPPRPPVAGAVHLVARGDGRAQRRGSHGVPRRRRREPDGLRHRLDDGPAGGTHDDRQRTRRGLRVRDPVCEERAVVLGREFRRMDHNLHPGTSRRYAWVLEGGEVVPGDPVLVEPERRGDSRPGGRRSSPPLPRTSSGP